MAVPDEARTAIARWCAAQVPADEREWHRVGWSVHGSDVTLVDRRAPTQTGPAWTSTPLALLRVDSGGQWTLHRPVPRGWRATTSGPDPVALLQDQAAQDQAPA